MQKDELYQTLRDDLVSGKFTDGQALPSGRQLASSYGANKDCANTVLAALEAEGLIKRDGTRRFPIRRHRSEERAIAVEHLSHRGAHPFSAGFNEGLLDSLLSLQYGVHYFTHYDGNSTPIHQAPVLASLLERNILKGVVFPHANRPTLEDLQLFREREVAVTSLEREMMPGAIVLDIEQAALRATHYLLSLGYSPVGMVCSRKFHSGREADVRGYRQALILQDKPVEEEIIDCIEGIDDAWITREDQAEPYDITLEDRYERIINSARDAVLRRINSGKLPRGLYIADEFLALGALRALHEAGVQIPDDVAIVSHSSANNWTFELSGLTTMRFDAYACGVQAGHFIVDMAEGKRLPVDRLILQASLIKGGSCGEEQLDIQSHALRSREDS